MWSYNIECQHSINRVAQFKKMFPDAVQTIERIVGCIPSMHIHNHKDDCQYRFAFKYTSNVGCTCGEGIEQTWAEANETGGSTKKENRGHRHDSLDDFHGYWNWEKILKMGLSQNIMCLTLLLNMPIQLSFFIYQHALKVENYRRKIWCIDGGFNDDLWVRGYCRMDEYGHFTSTKHK